MRSSRAVGQVLADVVRADRQLAVAAVGEHGQLDALGPAVVEERVDRRADRPAGVEDVVDEDARHSLEREVERRRADERLRVPRRLAAAHVDVVAVEGDVELAERDLGRRSSSLDPAAQPLRERHAARVDADERDACEVGDCPRRSRARCASASSRSRSASRTGCRCGGLRAHGALRAVLTSTPSRPHGTGLKGCGSVRDSRGSAGRRPR